MKSSGLAVEHYGESHAWLFHLAVFSLRILRLQHSSSSSRLKQIRPLLRVKSTDTALFGEDIQAEVKLSDSFLVVVSIPGPFHCAGRLKRKRRRGVGGVLLLALDPIAIMPVPSLS